MSYVGVFFCCSCSGDAPTQPVWMAPGRRALCRDCYTMETGASPPVALTRETLPVDRPWTPPPRYVRTGVLGWRALREADGSVRIDHVRNAEGIGTVSDQGIRLSPAQWVALILNVSGFADSGVQEQEGARHVLWKLHRGEES